MMTRDPFRSEYRVLPKDTADAIDHMKRVAEELLTIWAGFELRNPREIALARTHLEDAVMRATRGMST